MVHLYGPNLMVHVVLQGERLLPSHSNIVTAGTKHAGLQCARQLSFNSPATCALNSLSKQIPTSISVASRSVQDRFWLTRHLGSVLERRESCFLEAPASAFRVDVTLLPVG